MPQNQNASLTHARLLALLHYDPDTGIFYRRTTCNGSVKAGSQAEQNMQARRRFSNRRISPYKGVYANGNGWRATIQVAGVVKQLGTYPIPEEAHGAYCKAARELHGEFARFE